MAFFDFLTISEENTAIAATIFVSDDAAGQSRSITHTFQQKRSGANVTLEDPDTDPDVPTRKPRARRSLLTPEERYQHMLAGHGRSVDIRAHHNESVIAEPGLMQGLGGIGIQAAGFSPDLSGRMAKPVAKRRSPLFPPRNAKSPRPTRQSRTASLC